MDDALDLEREFRPFALLAPQRRASLGAQTFLLGLVFADERGHRFGRHQVTLEPVENAVFEPLVANDAAVVARSGFAIAATAILLIARGCVTQVCGTSATSMRRMTRRFSKCLKR